MSMTVEYKCRDFGHGVHALPLRQSAGSSGYDLVAALSNPIQLRPGDCWQIPCGFQMEMPLGYEAQIRSRSGLALKHGLTVLNSPGTIDSDYRGEICVILQNFGSKTVIIEPGMRIAQLVFAKVEHPEFLMKLDSLSETERDDKGFGSTGAR